MLSSEDRIEATCLHVAAEAVAVVAGLPEWVAGGAEVALPEPLVPELQAASSMAPAAASVAAVSRTGADRVTWDCMFIPDMLPGSGGQDVTPFGRDRCGETANHGMMSGNQVEIG
jgi:hypothetical protein